MLGFRLLIACVSACLLQSVGFVGSAAAANYSLSGYAWIDANGNRSKSIWEPKRAGVIVKLLNATTKVVIRAGTTNASGGYAFFNLPAGTYRLIVIPPAGYLGAFNDPISINTNIVRNFAISQPRSIQEKALNTFGDRWNQARVNPWLANAGAPGCFRRPALGMTWAFTQQELQFLGKVATRFYLEGCAVVLEHDPPFKNNKDYESSDRLKARLAQFKAALPTRKYIGYQRIIGWEVGQVGWVDIYQNHKDWFVYKKGTTVKTDANIVVASNGAWVLDLTNPAFQTYIANRLTASMTYYKIDGVVLDGVQPLPRLANPSDLPDAMKLAWENAWVAFLRKFKAAAGPNKFIFASIPRDNTPFARKIIPVVDGIMLEDTFSPVRNGVTIRMRYEQPIINWAAAYGKWIMTTENTAVDGSKFATTSYSKEQAIQRYYLAAFYIFNKGKMLYHYNPPSSTTAQYGAEAFFTDWNIKVGAPVGAYSLIPGRPDVYKRTYQNSVIYLNSSNTDYVINVPAGSQFNLDPDGNPITRYVLQAKTGFILSGAQAFQ